MARRRPRRPRWLWVAAAVGIVAVASGVFWWRRGARRPDTKEVTAPVDRGALREEIRDGDRRALESLIERKSGRAD